MTGAPVLIAALSGRGLAASARRAGYEPLVADAFGDSDTAEHAAAARCVTDAARIGFRSGDVIVQVGSEKIGTVNELEGQLKERRRVWQVVVKRGNQLLQLQLPG